MELLRSSIRKNATRGFTLIEMIGVLAILGILATVLTPNALKAIDKVAVKTESESLDAVADSLRSYLVENKTLPSSSNWDTALAAFSDFSSESLKQNPRGTDRVFILDPATSPSERVIIISGMRNGLALPSSGNINTSSKFQSIWGTADGEIPPTSSWGNWSKWNAVDGSGDYLLIERVNLKPIYLNELKTANIVLNNTTGNTCSYKLYDANGAQQSAATLPASTPVMLSNLAQADRIDVFSDGSYSSLVYTHIVNGKDISFDLSDWISTP